MPVTFPDKAQILTWLQAVKDPEIPTISLIDLGVVRGVEVDEATGKVSVHLTPTFAGCPAMDYMKRDVERTLGLSYPTVRARLDTLLASLGFGSAPPPADSNDERREVLEALNAGRLSAEEAISLLEAL